MARAGGGKAVFVTNTEDDKALQSKMVSLLRFATQAHPRDVNIAVSNLPNGIEYVSQIPEKPALLAGERLVSYAIFTGELKGFSEGTKDGKDENGGTDADNDGNMVKAVLTAKVGDDDIRQELTFALKPFHGDDAMNDHRDEKSMLLHRLAAKELIKQLEKVGYSFSML